MVNPCAMPHASTCRRYGMSFVWQWKAAVLKKIGCVVDGVIQAAAAVYLAT